jgi:transposase
MVFVIRERSGGGWDHGGAVSYCGVAGARRRACPVSVLARSGRSGSGACGFADAERLDQRAHQPSFRVREDVVRDWRSTFMRSGVEGLVSRDPSGRPPVKAQAALAVAEEVLSAPVADRPNWTLPRLASEIERRTGVTISKSRLSVVLRKKGA